MENGSRVGLTVILDQARTGDDQCANDLIAMIYQELRQVAARMMRERAPAIRCRRRPSFTRP